MVKLRVIIETSEGTKSLINDYTELSVSLNISCTKVRRECGNTKISVVN